MSQNREASRQVRRAQVLEHLDDAALRRRFTLRALGHLDDDVVAIFGSVPVPLRYLDRVPVSRVFRFDLAAVVARAPDAADPRRRVADAADQARDASAALVHADGENLDPVAMHERRRVRLRQYQGRGTVIGHDQHVAVGPAAHPPGHTLAFARRGEAVRPLDGLAVAHHRSQALAQGFALRSGVQAQPLGEARRGQGFRRLRQMLEQQFTARDGIRVSGFLEF